MRNFTFNGRLGKDAELSTTSGGNQYLKFSVANNSYSKTDGEKTDWIDVVCFDQFLVKSKQQVLKKGVYVIVSGELDPITTTTLQDGRLYINQHVNANFIEVPSFRTDNASGSTVTTANAAKQQEQPRMMPQQPVYSAQIPTRTEQNDGTEDLPF